MNQLLDSAMLSLIVGMIMLGLVSKCQPITTQPPPCDTVKVYPTMPEAITRIDSLENEIQVRAEAHALEVVRFHEALAVKNTHIQRQIDNARDLNALLEASEEENEKLKLRLKESAAIIEKQAEQLEKCTFNGNH